jgi:site-specific DNA recombinase
VEARPQRAIGYVRVSRVGGRSGDTFISPGLQEESIKRICAAEELKLVGVVQELDASGGDANRPLWNEAIQKIERGEAEALVVWNLSRFSRSLRDGLNAIERIEQAGGKLYSSEGNLGKLGRNIIIAVAEDERDRAKAGFYNAQQNALDRGIYISARIPFGYHRGPDRRLVPDPVTAPIVKEIFKRRINGVSWTDLARWAVEAHPEAPKTRKGIRDLVSNPAYIGQARGVGGLVNESAHEPIISKLDFDKASKRERALRTGTLKGATLLQGFAKCETCGQNLHVGWTAYKKGNEKTRETGYYCRNVLCADKAFIRSSVLDGYIEEQLLQNFDLSEARLKVTDDGSQLAAAEKALEEAEYDLSTWTDNVEGLKILGAAKWNEKAAELTTIRNAALQEVADLKSQKTADELPTRLSEVWQEWSLQSKREFIDKMIEKIVLEPAHRQPIPVQRRVMVFAKYDLTGAVETNDPYDVWEANRSEG